MRFSLQLGIKPHILMRELITLLHGDNEETTDFLESIESVFNNITKDDTDIKIRRRR